MLPEEVKEVDNILWVESNFSKRYRVIGFFGCPVCVIVIF
jgi:hypothetical protein